MFCILLLTICSTQLISFHFIADTNMSGRGTAQNSASTTIRMYHDFCELVLLPSINSPTEDSA